MTPSGKFIISSLSSPEEFADRVVERVRVLHERPALAGREGTPVSEEYLAKMRADLISRCALRGSRDDPQAKF